MSRDFELLQRLERDLAQPAALLGVNGNAVSTVIRDIDRAPAVEESFEVTHPSTLITGGVRDELSKLVLRMFLSVPSVSSVMFTGIQAHQASKWIAACSADLLAQMTRARVCFIDADFDHPTAHQMYSLPNRAGLAAALEGSTSIVNTMVRASDNLWVVPAGTRQEKSQLSWDRFQETIAGLLRQNDYLVISAPDCETRPEVATIGGAVEGAVLVLDAQSTRRAVARHAKNRLEVAKIRILGSVVSNQSLPVPELLLHWM